jgi:26S proteasome regulatory subunit N6
MEIKQLIDDVKPIIQGFAKAKAAKIIKQLIDDIISIKDTLNLQEQVLTNTIEWCNVEKRSFLKTRLELKYSDILFKMECFNKSLDLLDKLHTEAKKLDDKHLIVEISLLESRVNHALNNLPKSKASLTVARTSANSIYCPPLLQAEIDYQAGIVFAEERD